jgi:hypothetical protein
MSDVFISYAHEDQRFVRQVAQALEAEGFSVWWDHSIPPGQTWDTFIARGIQEAKAAVVVWSPHSATSDWVKEEATLARSGGKYVPVQIAGAEPPMGFTRIQAAQLANWNGSTENPQWQMLVGAVRNLVRERSGAPAAPRYVTPAEPPPRASAPPWAMIGGIAATAVVVGGAFVLFGGGPREEAKQETPIESASTTPDQSGELARLREEREQALAREREAEATAARERLAREAAERRAAQQQSTPSIASAAGTWSGSYTYEGMDEEYHVWELRRDYTVIRDGNPSGTWSQSGANVQIGSSGTCVYSGVMSGNRISGTARCANPPPGVFSMRRQ